MDINPFAVELAKVSLMLARKLAIDELHIADESGLPLDNLNANFIVGDALVTPVGATDGTEQKFVPTPWPAAFPPPVGLHIEGSRTRTRTRPWSPSPP